MALVHTQNAIGAVGELLVSQLASRTNANSVDVGRPEAAIASVGPKFNIFLYEVEIDGHLREHALDAGQPPPIWLVLHYLLTAVDDSNETDSTKAHRLVGEGMLALQELNFLRSTANELVDNPESLKITFEQADTELLSQIIQGADEHYRLSVAFQVRPVMVAPSEPPSYAPLVLTVGPPGDEGVAVIPSIGPCLSRIEPEQFVAGDQLRIRGDGLTGALQFICFGDVCYGVTGVSNGDLLTVVPSDTELSPGSHLITAVRETSDGRRSTSNGVVGLMLPEASAATVGAVGVDSDGNPIRELRVTGAHLGNAEDAIFMAFYKDGDTALMAEASGVATQDLLTAQIPLGMPPPGLYNIIVRANGAQSILAPEVMWP